MIPWTVYHAFNSAYCLTDTVISEGRFRETVFGPRIACDNARYRTVTGFCGVTLRNQRTTT